MLLVQAGASPTRRATAPSASATPTCARIVRVGFVADVAGLRSSVDAAGWRGLREATARQPCLRADLALPARPSDYRRALQADAGYDLVIAGSFLLADPVTDVARANPGTHFVLVDPIVTPSDLANLAVLTFRADQAAFLAGALAASVTQTGVIAGVYGPDGAMDRSNRLGFEHGAQYARPGVRVLGAYQPAGSAPYDDPVWGADQARAFAGRHADVIFGAGGTTGQGALLGASESGVACIGADIIPSTDPGCLRATAVKFIDRGVALIVGDALVGRWQGGLRTLGLAQRAVGLSLASGPGLTPDIRRRLQTITDLLAAGALATGG